MSEDLPAVRFFGFPHSKSGYGNAVKNISLAFSRSKVLTQFNFEGSHPDFEKKLNKFNGATKVDFYIQPPPFNKHVSNNYKIGYFYWEANILPKFWAKDIRRNLDELWVPCDLTRNACLRGGFKGPVEILHTPCDIDLFYSKIEIPSPITDELVLSDNTFKFYSIFQWNERKGYRELLEAYYKEFSENDDVVLILKVNPINHRNHGLSRIKTDILKIKKMVNKRNLPKIFLITNHISKEHLFGLHRECDCFVLPHHGEGWGMPIHDAMLCGSNVITTKFGGITELLDNDNSNIIKHKLGSVKTMSWSTLYNSSQTWAYPSTSHLKVLMRDIFENKNKYLYKTENARTLAASLDISSCSSMIENILAKKRFKRFCNA